MTVGLIADIIRRRACWKDGGGHAALRCKTAGVRAGGAVGVDTCAPPKRAARGCRRATPALACALPGAGCGSCARDNEGRGGGVVATARGCHEDDAFICAADTS